MFEPDPGSAPPSVGAGPGRWVAGAGRLAAGRVAGPAVSRRARRCRAAAAAPSEPGGAEMGAGEKENHPQAPRGTLRTPLKQAGGSQRVLSELQPGCQPLATPPKPGGALPAEPWTPTANLKVLISAASPEIRSRERSRGLQGTRCCQEHSSGDEYERSQPSRKEKSLGLLCHKFLARYPDYPSAVENNYICLDEVAEELNVERRRIYDIVNVLESLHMVSRLAKNRYIWHGRHNLAKTLQTLKKVGEENKYTQQIQMIKKREYEQEFGLDGRNNEEVARSFNSNEHSEMCFVELPGIEFRAASVNSRKDKSLRVMSQKFVMLFLVSTPQIVSLEVAAKILIGEDQLEDLDKSKFKTKIRRLYDIANVLSSLELIKKVHVTEERGRKPAFKWTGPEVPPNTQDTRLETTSAPCISQISEPTNSKEQCSKNLFPSRIKQNFTRHPSLIKLVKSIESDRRKIQSAPTSPVKISPSTDENVSAYTSKVSQLAAVPQYQLEEPPKRPKDMKNNVLGSALEHSLPWPEAAPKANTHTAAPPPKLLLTQPLGALPPSHRSASPVILPQPHSGASYAVYVHPSQAHAVTAYSPSFMLQPLPCANVTGIKSIHPKALSEMTAKEGDNCTAAADAGKATAAEERPVIEPESSSKRCLKRSQALQENNLIKKCRSDEESLETAVGELNKHERPPSIGSQTNNEMDNFQEEKQSRSEDQSVESCSEQYKRECAPEDEDRAKAKQDLPVAFAIPAHETFFPSGYLIPLTQCTHHSNKAALSNREKAGICSVQHTTTHSSPTAGVIPMIASEMKAVNIPAFHITSLNIMLSPASIAAAPVLNNSHLNSSSNSSVPNPSSSLLNFTLQHIGVMPAGVQVPANPVLQHIPILSKPESTNRSSSENATLQEEKPPVPKEAPEPQPVTENFFRTPGGPNTTPSLSATSGGTDTTPQGTSHIAQRKLEVPEN
ncbi:transcription factor E2F8 isoform X2 [Coturnix japonica]|uniref:transcription factor E2F8 isoform X2 n=1 Tax=Coturnix japonica TaxID=93934 RepID=UPI000776E462|nr:transcription factor E2F8 isoform X2 [Coturnix japonica]